MTDWRAAHALLRARADQAPELACAAAELPVPSLPFDPDAVRCVVTTGIGSSAAHAALFAHLLTELGLPARVAPPGGFVVAPRAAPHDVLVVFSQGLSPNARLALAHPERWAAVVLVTGLTPDSDEATLEKRRAMAAVEAAGGLCLCLPGGAEYGTLLRVAGPLAGYAIAFRLAAAVAAAAGIEADWLALAPAVLRDRLAAARAAATALCDTAPLDGPLALIASGGYGALAGNLSLKVQEGLRAPAPPIWDLIELAHGPYQALAGQRATLLVLARRGAPMEAELLARLQTMLDPARHRVVGLAAELPGAQAIFEHEVAWTELVLDAIARRAIDQSHRPDDPRDRPLYAIAEPVPRPAPAPQPPAALAALTWPELETRLVAGHRTAVLPLGATEQHGPHLPLGTDTVVAEALAARFCTRVPEAVRLPALPFGCSAEHLAFPGTVSLAADTLRHLLTDALTSLGRSGFDTVFVFSAHGGNAAALAEAARALGQPATGPQLIVYADLDETVATWRRTAADCGIDPDAAGHHAGELETSILLALSPGAVRRDRLAPGLLEVTGDAQAIFYPDLRRHAPTGVVGDPRAASARRAARYLDAWVELLVAHYRRTKKAKNTAGTHHA